MSGKRKMPNGVQLEPTSPLFEIARDEVQRWEGEFQPFARAILFCFIHRVTTGRTFEESFNSSRQPPDDYSI